MRLIQVSRLPGSLGGDRHFRRPEHGSDHRQFLELESGATGRPRDGRGLRPGHVLRLVRSGIYGGSLRQVTSDRAINPFVTRRRTAEVSLMGSVCLVCPTGADSDLLSATGDTGRDRAPGRILYRRGWWAGYCVPLGHVVRGRDRERVSCSGSDRSRGLPGRNSWSSSVDLLLSGLAGGTLAGIADHVRARDAGHGGRRLPGVHVHRPGTK